MKRISQILLLASPLLCLLNNCTNKENNLPSLQTLVQNTENIVGKAQNLPTPMVTAGNRLYMIGHQDGQFPDLGWHVIGEMGGIWNHPIKLMDGFSAAVQINQQKICLTKADEFINYPFANKHIYKNIEGLQIDRFQFVPDDKEALVVEYAFINKTNSPIKLQFEWTGHSDLRPVWLGERTNMIDDNDEATWQESSQSWLAKDKKNNWFVQFGANLPTFKHHQDKTCEFVSKGKGSHGSLVYEISVPANGQFNLPFTIAGSYQSADLAKNTFEDVQKNAFSYLESKRKRYENIEKSASVHIPDKDLEQAFRWVKYNTDWLIREVPEIGRGISAGLPDYPWWFGADGDYTLNGFVITGDRKTTYDFVDLLNTVSEKENGNGRIIHEVSTNGAVFNKGNLNEMPQFASMIAEIYRWTGEKAFLQKYFPTVKKGLNWLLAENDKDKNLLPDGFGMMEIHGMSSEMIDVAVYTQKAFADASYMAEELGEKELAKTYKNNAEILKNKINTDFWVAESESYADFIGTKEDALHLIDAAIIRADTLKKKWAVEELKLAKINVMKLPKNTKKGFVMHHNWVVNTPMETGIADPEKAKLALKTANKFTNPFGVFVTGIDRDESAGNDESSSILNRKVFSYTGAVMTLPTGVLTIGENNYGNPDSALDYLKRMTKTFGYVLPGSIYEVSPDYGMVVQAWNLYSFAVPIIKQFFGIRPNAPQKTVHIQPQMPTNWNTASVEQITVGDNMLAMNYEKTGEILKLNINQSQSEWKIQLSFPKGKFASWKVNGSEMETKSNDLFDFVELKGEKIEIELQTK